MKKLLLSFVALFTCLSMSAIEVVFDGTGTTWTSSQTAQSETKEGVTMECGKGVYSSGHYRFFKSQDVVFTSTVGKIVSIEFTCTANDGAQYGPGCFKAKDGDYTFKGNIGTWTGSVETVTFTASTNQVRATKVVVTIADAEGTVPTPRIRPASGKYYEPQVVTFTSDYQVYCSINNETDFQLYDPITMSVRLDEPGVYVVRAYAQDGEKKSDVAMNTIEIATIQTYTSIADLRAACTATSQASAPMVNFSVEGLVVTGAKNSNVFVTDGSQSYLLYGVNAKNLKKGDMLSGTVQGQLYMYNNLGELAVTDSYANVEVKSSDNPVTPIVSTISDVIDNYSTMESSYVKFENVKFQSDAVASKTISIMNEDGDEINIYDNWSTFTNYKFETTKPYNVCAYVAKYKETVQCYLMDESDLQILTDLLVPESKWSVEKITAQVGETVKATFTTTSTGDLNFTSSDEAIATVSKDGEITAVGAGTCTITASTAEDAKYLASTAVLTVTVTEVMGGIETFENGGFEEWLTESQPRGWKSTTTASNATLYQSTDAHSGNYAVGIKNGTSNFRLASKEFILPAGKYTMEFYAKSANDTLATQVRPGYAPYDFEKGAMGSYAYGDYSADLDSKEWTLISYTFELKEETQVNLVVMNPKSSATKKYADALIDDFKITVVKSEDVVPGDANEDGQVSVADLALIASYILGDATVEISEKAADVNNDGTITVADLSAIASMILNGDAPTPTNSIVGEWSGVREVTNPVTDVRIHYNFKADGSYEQIMEAWAQKRIGKYSVNGNTINMEVTSLEWLWDRENGYSGVYDEAGVKNFAEWKATFPEEATYTMTYSLESDGTLRLHGGPLGLDLIYVKNPGYQPQKHLW